MWACGSADVITDVFFLIQVIGEGLPEDFDPEAVVFFKAACLYAMLFGIYEGNRLMLALCIAGGTDDYGTSPGVGSPSTSPGLLLVACLRRSALNQMAEKLDETDGKRKQIWTTLCVQDVPSIALNIWYMKLSGGDLMSMIALIASCCNVSALCVW